MSDMWGGSGGDKSHLMTGMLVGKLSAAKGDIEYLERALRNTRISLDNVGSDSISAFAEANAWRQLALELIDEIKNPDTPRRFSAPDADVERARLLQHVHKRSYESSVEKGRKNGAYKIMPNAYRMAKEGSIAKVRGYLDELNDEIAKRKTGEIKRFDF